MSDFLKESIEDEGKNNIENENKNKSKGEQFNMDHNDNINDNSFKDEEKMNWKYDDIEEGKKKEKKKKNDENVSDYEEIDFDLEDTSEIANIPTSIFNNSSLFIEDSFVTIDELDKRKIKLGLVSKRSFKSVLEPNHEIRSGAIGLSFFSLFDKTLYKSLAKNAIRIGATLANKTFLRKLAYEVLDEVITNAVKQNRGFIKKNFQLSRQEISERISQLLDDNVDTSREPLRTEFIEGLAGIIEIGLIAQLVNYSLYDVSDLSQRVLSLIDDKIASVVDYQSLQGSIIIHNTRKAMNRIFGSTSRMANMDLTDDKYKSVDNSIIVDNFLEEMDQISEVLIMSDIRKEDIDNVFLIARIFRDRDLLWHHEQLKTITEEVVNYVNTNREGFDFIIDNYNMNLMLDNISKRSLLNFSRDFAGKMVINHYKFNNTIRNIKQSLEDDKAIIKIVSKQDILQNFSIYNHQNSQGVVYHSFIRRNIISKGSRKIFDVLTQKFKPSRNLVRKLNKGEDYIMLINESKNNGQDFINLVTKLNKLNVEAEESLFFRLVSECMPNLINGTLSQSAMLKEGDMTMLAAILSDYVYVAYDSYCFSILQDIYNDLQIDIDLKKIGENRNALSKDIIFVQQTTKLANHMDWFPSDFSSASITTREPRRIIATADNFSGDKGIIIISSMLEKGKYLVGKHFVDNGFDDNILIWPKNKKIDIKVDLDSEYADVDSIIFNIDFDTILSAYSSYSLVMTTKNIYDELIDEYVRVISIMRTQIIAAICSFDIDIDSVKTGIFDSGLDAIKSKIFDNQNYYINKKNIGHICQGFFFTINLYNTLIPEICSVENGDAISRDLHGVNRIWKLKGYINDININGNELLDQTKKNILLRRSLHYQYSYQYGHIQSLIKLYNDDAIFRNIVDSVINFNSEALDQADPIYAHKIVAMYSKELSNENIAIIQIIASVYIANLIRSLMSRSGDLSTLITAERSDSIIRYMTDPAKLDCLIYSRTKLILSRKKFGLSGFLPNGKSQNSAYTLLKSMYVNIENTEGYTNQILSDIDEENRYIYDDIKIE